MAGEAADQKEERGINTCTHFIAHPLSLNLLNYILINALLRTVLAYLS